MNSAIGKQCDSIAIWAHVPMCEQWVVQIALIEIQNYEYSQISFVQYFQIEISRISKNLRLFGMGDCLIFRKILFFGQQMEKRIEWLHSA